MNDLERLERGRRLARFASGVAIVLILVAGVRRAGWGHGTWSDLVVPVLVLSILGTSAWGFGGSHPRVARWLSRVNLVVALTLLAALLMRGRA